MRKSIIIFIGIVFSINLQAQESMSLSLEQAIDYALKNSYTAINASRDIDAAKLKKMGNHYYWITTNKC